MFKRNIFSILALCLILLSACGTKKSYVQSDMRTMRQVQQLKPEQALEGLSKAKVLLPDPLKQNIPFNNNTLPYEQNKYRIAKTTNPRSIKTIAHKQPNDVDISDKYKINKLSHEEKITYAKKDTKTAFKYFLIFTLICIPFALLCDLLGVVDFFTLIIATIAFTAGTLAAIALILAIAMFIYYLVLRHRVNA